MIGNQSDSPSYAHQRDIPYCQSIEMSSVDTAVCPQYFGM